MKASTLRYSSTAKRIRKSSDSLNRRDLSAETDNGILSKITASHREVELSLRYFCGVVQKSMLDQLAGSTSIVMDNVLRLHIILNNQCRQKHSRDLRRYNAALYSATAELADWSNRAVICEFAQLPADIVKKLEHAISSMVLFVTSHVLPTSLESETRVSVHRNSLPDLSASTPAHSISTASASTSGTGKLFSNQTLETSTGRTALSDTSDSATPADSVLKIRSALNTASPQLHLPPSPYTFNKPGFTHSTPDASPPPPLPPKTYRKYKTMSCRAGSAAENGRRRRLISDVANCSQQSADLSQLQLQLSFMDRSTGSLETFTNSVDLDNCDVYGSVGTSSSLSSSNIGGALSTAASDTSLPTVNLDQYGNWSPLSANTAGAVSAHSPAGMGGSVRPADINVLTQQLRGLSASSAAAAAAAVVTGTASVSPARGEPAAAVGPQHLPPPLPLKWRSDVTNELQSGSSSHHDSRLEDSDDCDRPPPLPVKKKHVLSYMAMLGDCGQQYSAEMADRALLYYNNISSNNNNNGGGGGSNAACGVGQLAATSPYTKLKYTYSAICHRSYAHDPVACESLNTPPPALPPKFKSRSGNGAMSDFHQNSLLPSTEIASSSSSPPNHAVVSDSTIDEGLVMNEVDDDASSPTLRGGTVDALVDFATRQNNHDFDYQEAFLTTYRTFMTAGALLDRLIERYSQFYLESSAANQRYAKNAFSLLIRVVDELTVPDLSVKLLMRLMEFEVSMLRCGDLLLARVLRSKVLEQYEAKRRVENPPSDLPSVPAEPQPSRCHSLLEFKSAQLARQMSLLDWRLFAKIDTCEMLLWAREQKEECSPNLTHFTEHFNKMSYWARSVLLTASDPRERERLMLKFCKIMKHLRKMNNFNSFLALLSALDSAPLRRLVWPKSIVETLSEYSSLIDSAGSFRAYRLVLADTQPPCIPYIGLILQDLTFVHIGNADFISEGCVNFVKRWQQYNILGAMKRFRKTPYHIQPADKVLNFFNDFNEYLSEEEMWTISETIKPRQRSLK